MTNDIQARLKNVKALFSDVDGILTDGSLYIGADHFELKRFSVEDGVGAAIARIAKLPLALISGRHSEATTSRAAQMKIEDVYQGYLNKIEPFNILIEKFGVEPSEVAYIGDGWIDLPIMERVGVPISVPDAPDMVKDAAIYITKTRGGYGVLREVVEMILTAQDRHEEVAAEMRRHIYKVTQ